jgi:5-methylcytosine-specific restriction endonuclease McrA
VEKYLWNQWRRQRGVCAISGRKLTPINAQIDHIIPRTKDRVINEYSNLRWVTKEANKLKSNMTNDVFKKLIIDVYNNFKIEITQ